MNDIGVSPCTVRPLPRRRDGKHDKIKIREKSQRAAENGIGAPPGIAHQFSGLEKFRYLQVLAGETFPICRGKHLMKIVLSPKITIKIRSGKVAASGRKQRRSTPAHSLPIPWARKFLLLASPSWLDVRYM